MFVKQLCVFLENRAGRLNSILDILRDNEINIIAVSLADTSEYGILRMMVSDAQKGKAVLKEAGFSAMVNDVICIKVSHKTGSLSKVLDILLAENISVEYMYAFANGKYASAVMKFSQPEKVAELIEKDGIEVWSSEEITSMSF
ncbi:MAG: amino acid-binding protein [Pelosinus sp.]|nr:amino acid-binding protein [Pelosinus sp.]